MSTEQTELVLFNSKIYNSIIHPTIHPSFYPFSDSFIHPCIHQPINVRSLKALMSMLVKIRCKGNLRSPKDPTRTQTWSELAGVGKMAHKVKLLAMPDDLMT